MYYEMRNLIIVLFCPGFAKALTHLGVSILDRSSKTDQTAQHRPDSSSNSSSSRLVAGIRFQEPTLAGQVVGFLLQNLSHLT